MKIEKILKENWAILSESAHQVVFGKEKPVSFDRIDFALLAVDEVSKRPLGYLTAREHDHETVYWQFGGAFPGVKDSVHSFPIYRAFVEWTRGKYKRITTLIENENTVMLKFAMKVGFRIVGIRSVRGSVLLEHVLEFHEGESVCGH
jgi:hypothetical protein